MALRVAGSLGHVRLDLIEASSASLDVNDPDVWSGRASQERSPSWLSGLASMYPASDSSSLLRAIMDISARAI